MINLREKLFGGKYEHKTQAGVACRELVSVNRKERIVSLSGRDSRAEWCVLVRLLINLLFLRPSTDTRTTDPSQATSPWTVKSIWRAFRYTCIYFVFSKFVLKMCGVLVCAFVREMRWKNI